MACPLCLRAVARGEGYRRAATGGWGLGTGGCRSSTVIIDRSSDPDAAKQIPHGTDDGNGAAPSRFSRPPTPPPRPRATPASKKPAQKPAPRATPSGGRARKKGRTEWTEREWKVG